MAFGSGKLTYEVVEGWGKLPEGWTYTQVTGVVVDSQDRVYVFNRGEHPLVIFDREGNFLRSWGEGVFNHPHGIYISPDEHLYFVDRYMQTMMKYTLDGQHLLTIGVPDQIGENGAPFNHPTDVATSPSGEIYISDGYRNARVHKYAPDGTWLLSWGEPGTDPGQFNLPHSVWIDKENRVFVADRQNNRIQIFTPEGKFMTQWTDFLQPTDIYVDEDDIMYISELRHRVSIVDLNGKLLARWGGEKSDAPGQFIAPHGIWADSHDDLYVAEVLEGQRIQKFVRKR